MKRSRLALAIAALPLAAAAESSLDYEQALKLPNTVVTASRTAQDSKETTAAVTVFTRDDIERLQPVNVADLLSRVPGVQVQQSGGRGSSTNIMIRGTSNAQSLVLVDGVRVGSASAGGASLQHLNLEQIERIEVLRGARSAVYGSDAIGGVIQIFTRRGSEGLQGRVRVAAGNKGLWERSLGLSGGDQQTTFNLSASLDEMSGFDRTHKSFDSDADHDAYRNKAFSFSLAHAFTDRVKAGVNFLEQRGKTEYDNPYGRSDSNWVAHPAEPYDKFKVSSVSAYFDVQATDQWNTKLTLGHSEDKSSNYDKLFAGVDDFNTYRDSATWLNTLSLTEQHSLLFGADYLKDKLRSTGDFTKTSRWNQAAFIQHNYRGELFGTELGLRHDKNQQFGNENTWNAALTIPFDQNNELTVSYAEAFKAPTFNDLYSQYPDISFYGNPSLKAETSKSFELLLKSQLSENVSVESALYRTDISNLIASEYNRSNGITKMQNVKKARINGFEASLLHKVYDLDGSLNISIIDPRDRKSGHQLPRRAKRTLSYDLDKQLGAFGMGATWKLASSSYNDDKNTKTIAGYGTLDLRGSWQANDELGFDLRLGNIFDKGYTRALYNYKVNSETYSYGYREDPFTIRLGLTWTPNL
ncbi:TonB-dependent receptor domain-containing protein [Thiopseudomonas alkaliphila]|uniref:TonB-dependent receptor n=1 Tax=Thiopseudomonas alkaliphila TaxID=1697053 RepID=A0A0K1XCW2_9GAMM|nr:TonB-dependent receptor [Thiopseudomonas alkaliphila]AKX59017.1 TonB-dependent receptor [Thiopseudomonas alkaliphila]